ncbi:cupin domain-containing protein [Candidatus Pacearchaeota archaeon]|nr:cupin domain-containing protein [Candidatus Pacearchaeota archaeon]
MQSAIKLLGGQIHDKGWGQELWLHNSENLCVKILDLDAGCRFSLHLHRNKEEVFYVLKGRLELESRDMATGAAQFDFLGPGDAILIPRMVAHRLTVVGDEGASILESSTHHEDKDSYRVEPGDSQKKKDATK